MVRSTARAPLLPCGFRFLENYHRVLVLLIIFSGSIWDLVRVLIGILNLVEKIFCDCFVLVLNAWRLSLDDPCGHNSLLVLQLSFGV